MGKIIGIGIMLSSGLTLCSGAGRLRTMTFNVTNINENTLYATSADVTLASRAKTPVQDTQRLPTVVPQAPVIEPSKPFYYLPKKHTIIVAGVILSYTVLVALLWWYQWRISYGNGWSCWKGDVSLAYLKQEDQQFLVRELFGDIRKYYTNEHDPLVTFMSQVEAESIQLKNFLALRKRLEAIKLSYILPEQQQTITQAHAKLDRLAYLKKLITRCLHEYSHDKICA